MLDHEQERAELLEFLVAAIRSRSDEFTKDEARTIASLWVQERHASEWVCRLTESNRGPHHYE
jgi:hypothetical protein